MNLAIETLQTHVFALIRDESGNKMNLCTRLECCVQNECVAVFEGRWLDLHYFVRGAPFQHFTGRKLFRIAGAQLSYSAHRLEEEMDRFDMSYHVFCQFIQQLHVASSSDFDEWRLVSINKELFDWLEKGPVLDPHLLSFICAWQGERRVY